MYQLSIQQKLELISQISYILIQSDSTYRTTEVLQTYVYCIHQSNQSLILVKYLATSSVCYKCTLYCTSNGDTVGDFCRKHIDVGNIKLLIPGLNMRFNPS